MFVSRLSSEGLYDESLASFCDWVCGDVFFYVGFYETIDVT